MHCYDDLIWLLIIDFTARYMAKNLLAVLFGFLLSILLIVLCDITFALINGMKIRNSDFWPDSKDIEGLGTTPRESSRLKKVDGLYVISHRKKKNGEILWNVNYSFNNNFRRIVPSTHEIEADRFVAFFGGSQTFGSGLNDNETIPAQVQKYTKGYRVYNFAYRGYGPHQMLRIIESGTLKDEIAESIGIAFYQYIDAHIARAIGKMSWIRSRGADAPYYMFNSEHEVVQNGTFGTGRFPEGLIYWLLGTSKILEYFNVDMPVITEHHHELVCGIVAKAQDEFLKQFPNSRFVVLLGFGVGPKSFIEQCLLSKQIEYIDLRSLKNVSTGLTYKNDGHYTPTGARVIADHILEKEKDMFGEKRIFSD